LRHDIRRCAGAARGLGRARGLLAERGHLREIDDVVVVALVGADAEIRVPLQLGQ
jgi:hypothetical protein